MARQGKRPTLAPALDALQGAVGAVLAVPVVLAPGYLVACAVFNLFR